MWLLALLCLLTLLAVLFVLGVTLGVLSTGADLGREGWVRVQLDALRAAQNLTVEAWAARQLLIAAALEARDER